MAYRDTSSGPRAVIFVRIAVGLIFLMPGILQYTDAHMGVERVTLIGLIPELTRAGQGFWFMVSDARTDFAIIMCLLFLLFYRIRYADEKRR